MAVEKKRGCGYRKVGGLYITSPRSGLACDRLPIKLVVCPTCGEGIKQSRGWTWIDPYHLFDGNHVGGICICPIGCPVCYPSRLPQEDGTRREGLLWVGVQHYPTTHSFKDEVAEQGLSKRIKMVPHDFVLGRTWIFLAHPKAIVTIDNDEKEIFTPGVFMGVRPMQVDRIVDQSDYDILEMSMCQKWGWFEDSYSSSRLFDQKDFDRLRGYLRDIDRGITLVPVPDDDEDHHDHR